MQSESLDVPITQEEVKAAITSMKPGKSPGADGLPSEYYKKYVDTLAPILTEVYTEAFEAEVLPGTFMEAVITLIPKKDRDLTSSLALNGGGHIFFLPVLSLIFPACSLVLSCLIY